MLNLAIVSRSVARLLAICRNFGNCDLSFRKRRRILEMASTKWCLQSLATVRILRTEDQTCRDFCTSSCTRNLLARTCDTWKVCKSSYTPYALVYIYDRVTACMTYGNQNALVGTCDKIRTLASPTLSCLPHSNKSFCIRRSLDGICGMVMACTTCGNIYHLSRIRDKVAEKRVSPWTRLSSSVCLQSSLICNYPTWSIRCSMVVFCHSVAFV
ncbi:uncharacterized protein PV09_03018 [Verruconis gallopava]|uniref:Uncharacterized protein n=1 Tax=Verruconis gallopava TaxID=253628 RepID=A0A0D1YYN4_9PEZI|nr:uncharacterized protein PV09_03018 [Verruconis gallopava]KIW05812.1 hypothetical protein PV09_03018 [Verruconis gallopava]